MGLKTPEELHEANLKLAEALQGCSDTDVLYLVAEIATFCCMAKAETLTEALDYWDSYTTASRNHIKRTFGKAYDFMREKELEESLQRAIDNPPLNTKME